VAVFLILCGTTSCFIVFVLIVLLHHHENMIEICVTLNLHSVISDFYLSVTPA